MQRFSPTASLRRCRFNFSTTTNGVLLFPEYMTANSFEQSGIGRIDSAMIVGLNGRCSGNWSAHASKLSRFCSRLYSVSESAWLSGLG